jgi:hypothetical protein
MRTFPISDAKLNIGSLDSKFISRQKVPSLRRTSSARAGATSPAMEGKMTASGGCGREEKQRRIPMMPVSKKAVPTPKSCGGQLQQNRAEFA